MATRLHQRCQINGLPNQPRDNLRMIAEFHLPLAFNSQIVKGLHFLA